MLSKDMYTYYKENLKKNGTLDAKEIQKLSEDYMSEAIELYLQENHEVLKSENLQGKILYGLFLNAVNDKLSYYIGVFSATVKIFMWLLDLGSHHKAFYNKMKELWSKPDVETILRFLYESPDSHVSTILDSIELADAGCLTKVLEELEEVGCVEQYGSGELSYYSVSVKGRCFIKEAIQ